MARTQVGKIAENSSAIDKAEFKADLDKLAKVPLKVLHKLVDKIAKTHPACNTVELAALEAEQSAIPDAEALSDAISSFTYIWENMDGESPQAVAADLTSLGLLSDDTARILTELLVSAEPFRETARAASSYLRVGSALFASISGTVDLRLRFHKTEEEFARGKLPTALVAAQQVIMANLAVREPNGQETIVSFLMDDNDLSYMKRFVRNMERELELSKALLKSSGDEGNG